MNPGFERRRIPLVIGWLVLTELGELAGTCLLDCKKKLSGIKRG